MIQAPSVRASLASISAADRPYLDSSGGPVAFSIDQGDFGFTSTAPWSLQRSFPMDIVGAVEGDQTIGFIRKSRYPKKV